MGLDMYLYRRNYVKNWDHMAAADRHDISVKKGGAIVSHIKPERICEITEEVGYWRKANAIHGWFVDHVQGGTDDCKEYYVSRELLQELLRTVEQVLADRSRAKELLPVRKGFFFGSDEYDKYYFEALKDTKRMLTVLLQEPEEGDFYYQSSW